MNYYSRAIDILEEHTSESDQRKILVEIAKTNPAVLCKVCDKLFAKKVSWQETVIPILKAGQKIEAIKQCRNLTGMDLRTAKEAVEKLMDNGYKY